MERHLEQRQYFVIDHCSIADISLFAYTHVAHEGGFDLSTYPAITSWISRMEALDGYLGMLD
jgi:glutathione S-transferase